MFPAVRHHSDNGTVPPSASSSSLSSLSYQELPSGPGVSVLSVSLTFSRCCKRRSASAFESLALRTDDVTSLGGAVTSSAMAEAWLMNINDTAWRARYPIGYEAGVLFGGRRYEYQSGLYPGSLPSATSSQRKINIYHVRASTSATLCLLFQSQKFWRCF